MYRLEILLTYKELTGLLWTFEDICGAGIVFQYSLNDYCDRRLTEIQGKGGANGDT